MPLAVSIDNLPVDTEDGHGLIARVVDLQVYVERVLAQVVVPLSNLCDGANNDALRRMHRRRRQLRVTRACGSDARDGLGATGG